MVIPEYVTPAVAYILLYVPVTCCSMGYTVPCEYELKLFRRLKYITRIVENIPETVLGFHPFVTMQLHLNFRYHGVILFTFLLCLESGD